MGKKRSEKLKLYTGEVIDIDHDHHKFARHYAMYGIGSKSYRHATGGCKSGPDGDSTMAYKWARREDVVKAVEHYRKKSSDALDISESRILAELAAVGLASATDLLDDDGKILAPGDMPTTSRRAIQSYKTKVSTDKDGNDKVEVEFTLAQKVPALRTIAEIKGMGKISENKATKVVINNKISND